LYNFVAAGYEVRLETSHPLYGIHMHVFHSQSFLFSGFSTKILSYSLVCPSVRPSLRWSLTLIIAHIAASSTATDDITHYFAQRIFNVNLQRLFYEQILWGRAEFSLGGGC